MKKLTAVDAFCGAGGLSLGLISAGFEVVAAFDNDQIAVDTYVKNVDARAFAADAAAITASDIAERGGIEELDLLTGGPPCQGFSVQRRGTRTDDRNQLVLHFLRLISELRPRVYLMENVPTIRGPRGRAFLKTVDDRTRALGYRAEVRVVNAFEYAVPQRRRRAIMVGTRLDAEFEWPTPRPSGPRTVRDAIGDLPSPPKDGSPHPTIANHYREARLSALNRERIRAVPEGGGRADLPAHLTLPCHRGGHRHLDTYGRLAWDEPAATITARFDSFTRGRFGHPSEDRSITLREGARLQGFPDDFVFLGNREEGARLIGNAVPPPLAEALGRSVSSYLEPPAPRRSRRVHPR